MSKTGKFLVYENWRVNPNKAMVHKSEFGFANEAHERIEDNWLINNSARNDRWFGYFENMGQAISFAALLPNRVLKLCGHCMKDLKGKL